MDSQNRTPSEPAGAQAVEPYDPPTLTAAERRVGPLATIRKLRKEMSRVYRLARAGKIEAGEMSRYIYALDRQVQAQRVQGELALMQQGEVPVPFRGVVLVGPKQPETG